MSSIRDARGTTRSSACAFGHRIYYVYVKSLLHEFKMRCAPRRAPRRPPGRPASAAGARVAVVYRGDARFRGLAILPTF